MWVIKKDDKVVGAADCLDSLNVTCVRHNDKVQELKDLVLNKIVFDDGGRVQYIRGNLWVAFDKKDKQVCCGTREECEMIIDDTQKRRIYEGGAIVATWDETNGG